MSIDVFKRAMEIKEEQASQLEGAMAKDRKGLEDEVAKFLEGRDPKLLGLTIKYNVYPEGTHYVEIRHDVKKVSAVYRDLWTVVANGNTISGNGSIDQARITFAVVLTGVKEFSNLGLIARQIEKEIVAADQAKKAEEEAQVAAKETGTVIPFKDPS